VDHFVKSASATRGTIRDQDQDQDEAQDKSSRPFGGCYEFEMANP